MATNDTTHPQHDTSGTALCKDRGRLKKRGLWGEMEGKQKSPADLSRNTGYASLILPSGDQVCTAGRLDQSETFVYSIHELKCGQIIHLSIEKHKSDQIIITSGLKAYRIMATKGLKELPFSNSSLFIKHLSHTHIQQWKMFGHFFLYSFLGILCLY